MPSPLARTALVSAALSLLLLASGPGAEAQSDDVPLTRVAFGSCAERPAVTMSVRRRSECFMVR